MKIVLVSTVNFSKEKPQEWVRNFPALNGVRKACSLGITTVLVDAGSDDEFITQAKAAGAIIHTQTGSTLGAARRQVIELGLEHQADWLIYSELEKDSFIADIPRICKLAKYIGASLVIPRRKNLDSYPAFQAKSETKLNQIFFEATTFNLDIAFGPRIFKPELASYFLEYEGEYGDKWDSIFTPVQRALNAGCSCCSIDTDYLNPLEQTLAEEQSILMRRKRIEQFELLSSAIQQEERLFRLAQVG